MTRNDASTGSVLAFLGDASSPRDTSHVAAVLLDSLYSHEANPLLVAFAMRNSFSFSILALLPGCATYMALMGGIPLGGSFEAVNTTSNPLCRVEVVSASDPSVVFDNKIEGGPPLLTPGGTKRLQYPIGKTAEGGPAPVGDFQVTAYGCQSVAGTAYKPDSTPLFRMQNVSVKDGPVSIR